MKNLLIRISCFSAFALAAFISNGQVKVQYNGHVGLGTVNPNPPPGTSRSMVTSTDEVCIHSIDNYTGLLLYFDHQGSWYQSMCTKVTKTETANYTISKYTKTSSTTGYYKDLFWINGDGVIYSNGIYMGSDSTLKYAIKPLQNSLAKVLRLQGVSYKLKSEIGSSDESATHIGFIAQEVEKVVPEVVKKTYTGIKAVNYPEMVSLLTEAMKEQQNQIDEMKIQIAEMQAALDIKPNNSNSSEVNNKAKPLLNQNQPNPFSENTTIKYMIPADARHSILKIYSSGGDEIKTYTIDKNGIGEVLINGGSMAPGTYIYSLFVDNKQIDSKIMILTKN